MVDVLPTIIEVKTLIYNYILPKLDFIEDQIENEEYDNNSSLKLLANVACDLDNNILAETNNKCYARTGKGGRCKNNIKEFVYDSFEISSMYCKDHCLICERETRTKLKNTLLYGDIRLIVPNYPTDKYINNKEFRLHEDYKNLKNSKELFNILCKISNIQN